MKKLKMGALFLGLMATLSLSACGDNYADSVDVPTTISYDTLSMIAEKPSYVSNDYSVKTNSFNIDSSITLINCYNSMLGVDSNGYLKKIETGTNVTSVTPSNSISDYSGKFSSKNRYYYSSSYPIVLYTTYDDSSTRLSIVDSNGYSVYSRSFGTYYYIESADSKYVDNYLLFTLTISGTSGSSTEREVFYFIYDTSDILSGIRYSSAEEYANATSSSSVTTTKIYKDGLTPVYSNEKIISYYSVDKNSLVNIYNEYKEFVNSFNPTSFGIDIKNSVRIGNNIFFYKNVEYYQSELEKGSEKKYKNKCLIVDLSNGKISYNDDFKYYIEYATQRSYDTKKEYALIKYYSLKEDRTLSNILMYSIMTDEIDFSNSFAYDGEINSVTKISSNYLIAKIDENYYLISKNSRTLLNGLTDFKFYEDGNIMYKNNQDNLYYYVSSSEFESKYKEIGTGFGYVSKDKYDGKNIGCKYDSSTYKYTYGTSNVKSDYLTFINYGVIVCENDVYVVNNKVSTYGSEVKVSSVGTVVDTTKTKVFSVVYDNGVTRYVKVSYSKKINN